MPRGDISHTTTRHRELYMKPKWTKSRTLYIQNYLFAMTIRYFYAYGIGSSALAQ